MNTHTKTRPFFWAGLSGFVWLLLLLGTGLLIFNIGFYAQFGLNHPFILEKELAGTRLWLLCLIIHIPASVVCLVAGLLQLLPVVQRRFRRVHKALGRKYVFTVLLPLTPTGLYLGFFAKGGVLGKSAFLFMGILLLWSTWQGLLCAMQKDIPAHKRWMARSYALAAVAITFRVVHIVFFELGMSAETNYVTATWFSIFFNLGVAECFASRSYWSQKYQEKFNERKVNVMCGTVAE